MRFDSIAVLAAGETPWTARQEPTHMLGSWIGDSVEAILEAFVEKTGEQRLAPGLVAWWDRGDVLYVVPLRRSPGATPLAAARGARPAAGDARTGT